jgi:transcriptional regulator with XRE-family HTH domain
VHLRRVLWSNVFVAINRAVRELRRAYGESQQAFATRLGLSMRAVANYEKRRHPDTRSLILLTKAALEAGRKDLVAEFSKAMDNLGEELGIYSNRDDALRAEIGKELVFGNDFFWAEEELTKLIERKKQERVGLRTARWLGDADRDIQRLEKMLVELRKTMSRVHLSAPGDKVKIQLPHLKVDIEE